MARCGSSGAARRSSRCSRTRCRSPELPATTAFELVEVAHDQAVARLRPDHAERLCVGHFPGDPFLPGAYLVELMADLAAVLLGIPGAPPAAVERATFRAPVRPDQDVSVHARRHDGGTVEAEVRVGGHLGAHARLRFVPPA